MPIITNCLFNVNISQIILTNFSKNGAVYRQHFTQSVNKLSINCQLIVNKPRINCNFIGK
jgi:hypothetical protein